MEYTTTIKWTKEDFSEALNNFFYSIDGLDFKVYINNKLKTAIYEIDYSIPRMIGLEQFIDEVFRINGGENADKKIDVKFKISNTLELFQNKKHIYDNSKGSKDSLSVEQLFDINTISLITCDIYIGIKHYTYNLFGKIIQTF